MGAEGVDRALWASGQPTIAAASGISPATHGHPGPGRTQETPRIPQRLLVEKGSPFTLGLSFPICIRNKCPLGKVVVEVGSSDRCGAMFF